MSDFKKRYQQLKDFHGVDDCPDDLQDDVGWAEFKGVLDDLGEAADEIERQAKRIAELQKHINAQADYHMASAKRMTVRIEELEQIIAAYYDGWPEPWAECMDGFEMQEFAEKHGIMDRVEKTTPCAEGCSCAEYHGDGETVDCFVLRPEFRVKAALKGIESDE